MKKLLNTLYIVNPNRYLSLDGENIVVLSDDTEIARVPLHNLEAIVTFGYTGASPALMGACAKNNIDLTFMTSSGRFLARTTGMTRGNVMLRKEQYRISAENKQSLEISKNFIIGKIYNSRWILERATRDYPLRVDVDKMKSKSKLLDTALKSIKNVSDADQLRGIEGEAASTYFSCFNDLILQQNEDFIFKGRNKRPPTDMVNALLSFAYTMLAGMCGAALETVGLDPYVGFLHTDRPGRMSLALDLMEEFRGIMADRFVLTLINKRLINKSHFCIKENGAVYLDEDGRKVFLSAWQSKKQEIIKHPFLKEKIEWGIAPFAQAMLLARFIRGDIDEYPPFFWK